MKYVKCYDLDALDTITRAKMLNDEEKINEIISKLESNGFKVFELSETMEKNIIETCWYKPIVFICKFKTLIFKFSYLNQRFEIKGWKGKTFNDNTEIPIKKCFIFRNFEDCMKINDLDSFLERIGYLFSLD